MERIMVSADLGQDYQSAAVITTHRINTKWVFYLLPTLYFSVLVFVSIVNILIITSTVVGTK